MIQDAFREARASAVPLVAITTPDPAQTVGQIVSMYPTGKAPFLYQWDLAQGIRPMNQDSADALRPILGPDRTLDQWSVETINPVEAIIQAAKFPGWQEGKSRGSILFCHNFHAVIRDNPALVQAVWNLRDQYVDRRTLVMMGPSFEFGAELQQDVLLLDEPLPGEPEIAEIVTAQFKSIGEEPEPEALRRATSALLGLAAFPSVQATCLALRKRDGKATLDEDQLWRRKVQMIESTRGLSVWRGGNRFSDIGGCSNIKAFMQRIISGRRKPRLVVFLDEIEKMLAGSTGIGDSSGTSQAMLGKLLSEMQDRNYLGTILVGIPGAAKTEIAKCTGVEAGVPTIAMNLGDMKGSLVGQSEQQMSQAMKILQAVGQGDCLFIGTCNRITSLPPELKRRFALGTYFFDLPDAEEREAIWKIYLKKFDIDTQEERPEAHNWTGAEIRTACMMRADYGIPLTETANYIVPVAESMGDELGKLRQQAAANGFISAAYPGKYRMPSERQPQTWGQVARQMEVS